MITLRLTVNQAERLIHGLMHERDFDCIDSQDRSDLALCGMIAQAVTDHHVAMRNANVPCKPVIRHGTATENITGMAARAASGKRAIPSDYKAKASPLDLARAERSKRRSYRAYRQNRLNESLGDMDPAIRAKLLAEIDANAEPLASAEREVDRLLAERPLYGRAAVPPVASKVGSRMPTMARPRDAIVTLAD